MDFIPQPSYGRIAVSRRADGRFGAEDPAQWPQLFSLRYPYLCAIQRRPQDPHDPLQIMWWTPTLHDMDILKGVSPALNLGKLKRSCRDKFHPFVKAISERVAEYSERRQKQQTSLHFAEVSVRTTFDRLAFPASYRDMLLQVAALQRYYLEAVAYLEFDTVLQPKILGPPGQTVVVRKDLMGVFTNDPSVAGKYMNGGVPVWFMRQPDLFTEEDVVLSFPLLTEPADSLVLDHGIFPSSPIYVGQAGEQHHAALQHGGHLYIDIEPVPIPFTTGNYIKTPSAASSSRLPASSSSSSPATSNPSVSTSGVPSAPGPIRTQKSKSKGKDKGRTPCK